MTTQNIALWSVAFATATIAQATRLEPTDPTLSVWAALLAYAVAGWACAQLKTLAHWVGGSIEIRLEILQNFVIALCAGLGVALSGLYLAPEWWPELKLPRIAIYLGCFFGAYGGVAVLTAVKDAVIGVIQNLVARTGKPKDPTAPPPGGGPGP